MNEEEIDGISAQEVANFSNHIKDIPTIILKDVLADIVYELKERDSEEEKETKTNE